MSQNITAKVLGGATQTIESFEGDVKALKLKLGIAENYKASINGSPVEDSQAIASYAFVTFAPAVKGA